MSVVDKLKLKNLQEPITIDKFNWCYVEGNKVSLIHEVRDVDGTWRRTEHIKIPFRVIKKWFK